MTYAKAPSISPGWGSRRTRKLFGAIPTVEQERAMRAAYQRASESLQTKATSNPPKRQTWLNRAVSWFRNRSK